MDKKAENISISNVRVIENKFKDKMVSPIVDKCNDYKKGKGFCVDVDSDVVGNIDNIPITPVGLPGGVVVRIPVVLATLTVTFNVHADIKLPEPVLEITNIRKKLKVTQCMLLQPTNILFISGFVRKNIEYTTGRCSNRKGVCGDIRHCTVDVPFQFSTPVDFTTTPADLLTNTGSEFEYFRSSDLPDKHFAEKDHLLSGDLSEINQFSTENFNELPFCDLITASVYEFDEFIGRKRPCDDDLPFEEKYFSLLEEKMVIQLTLNLLQKRSVSIPAVAGSSFRCDV